GDRGGGRGRAALRSLRDRGGAVPKRRRLTRAIRKEQKHDITDPVEMEEAADALPIEQIAPYLHRPPDRDANHAAQPDRSAVSPRRLEVHPLLSDAASYVNGAIVNVDGGSTKTM